MIIRLSTAILIALLGGYLIGRFFGWRVAFRASFVLGATNIVLALLIIQLSYFDVPGHRLTVDEYFKGFIWGLFVFVPILIGGKIGSYFKGPKTIVF